MELTERESRLFVIPSEARHLHPVVIPSEARDLHLTSHRCEIRPVPRGRNRFERRERPWPICTRRDPELAQFADMPVLLVHRIPELDRALRRPIARRE